MNLLDRYQIYLSSCDEFDDALTFEEYASATIRMEQWGE